MLALTLALTLTGAAPAAAAAVSPAGTQGDWFASLYTGEGVELRADERVFALFAVLNAVGYDVGPVSRQEPVAKVLYHPVRQQVRARVLGGDDEVRKAADAFFDAHPVSLRKYLSYVANAGPPPFASGAKGKDAAELKGLESLLAKAWAGWRLEELMGSVQGEYRKSLKAYLSAIDAPLQKARAVLKVSDSAPEAVLVLNLLDAHGSVRGAQADDGVLVVVGPADKPNVEGVVREYARAMIEPTVSKRAAAWSGGATMLREAQVYGAPDQTVGDYATSLVATAVALKAMNASDADFEAAAGRGYFGAKDIARQLDDGKPIDGWVLEALQKAESRRPAKK